MAGGLLSLVSQGQQSVLLYGNPSKTFFKTTYAKTTNFGLQKFRIDYEGAKTLNLTEESTFLFKVPRYADLLMDTYITLDLPNIWSPIFPPTDETENEWAPYEFRWIDNIGAMMVQEVEITSGNMSLQKYSGNYIASVFERDFS